MPCSGPFSRVNTTRRSRCCVRRSSAVLQRSGRNVNHKNAFWQLAYHTLFFTHLYLQRDEAAFQRWAQHRGPDDGIEGDPYTQAQVLEYWSFCDCIVDDAVDALDLDSAESGFSWYRMSKLEHQLVNIRHIQHHGAQLADRLRSAA